MNAKTILIVEDEVLIAETIKMFLEDVGFSVAGIAISYDQATEIINNNSIDIALIDIRLYGSKSGIDLAHYLKKEKQNIPFIYLTSQYDKRILKQALHTDPMGYLVKPIQKESLYTTIETALDKIKKSNKEEQFIQIKSGKTTHIIDPEKVVCIKADHVYCEIYLNPYDIIHVRDSLSKLLSKFNDFKILRCHRSYAVNYAYVKNWDQSNLVMKNDMNIPVSRSYRNDIIHVLDND